MHIACEKGHADVTEYLLAHDADVEARDQSGNTPLHIAAQNQQTKVVQILLDAGTDPDPENLVRQITSAYGAAFQIVLEMTHNNF